MNILVKAIIAIVIIIAIIFFASRLLKEEDTLRRIVTKHAVRKMTIEKAVYGSGRLRCSRRAEITSELDAKIDEIMVKEGASVKKDELLCRLVNDKIDTEVNLQDAEVKNLKEAWEKKLEELKKPVEERTAVIMAQLELDRAKDDRDSLKRQLEDVQKKIEAGIDPGLSDRDIEDLKTKIKRAEKGIEIKERKLEDAKKEITEAVVEDAKGKYEQAKHALEDLKEKADSREVKSPIDGTVLEVHIDEDMLEDDPDKEFNAGTKLFTVADLSSIMVKGMVFESDEDKLAEEQKVKVEAGAGAGGVLMGTLKRIPLTLSGGGDGGRLNIEIEFDHPPKNLKEGVRVNFRIIIQKVENVLGIPVEYVKREKGKYYVDLVKGKQVSRREIMVGISNDQFYQVLKGLREGDVVMWESEGP